MARDAPSNVLDSHPDVTHTRNPVYRFVQCTEYSHLERTKSWPYGCSTQLMLVGNVTSRKRPSTNVETDMPEPKRRKLEAENEGRDDVPSAFPKNEISTRSQYEPMMVDQDLWPQPVFCDTTDTAERELMRRKMEEEDMDIDDDGGGAGDRGGELCFHVHVHLMVTVPVQLGTSMMT